MITRCKPLLVLVFVLAAGLLAAEGFFKKGDDLAAYAQANKNDLYSYDQVKAGDWPEMLIQKVQASAKQDMTKPYLLCVEMRYFIGVWQLAGDGFEILWDTDGDGKLDTRYSGGYFVPWWVIHLTSPGQSAKNNLAPIMDTLWAAFESDAEPFSATAAKEALNSITRFYDNKAGENRDLFYIWYLYFFLEQPLPLLSYYHIKLLDGYMKNRFGASHDLLLLYKVESEIALSDLSDARVTLANLLSRHPNFAPALYYDARLTIDPAVKKNKLLSLRKNHPNHWIVLANNAYFDEKTK